MKNQRFAKLEISKDDLEQDQIEQEKEIQQEFSNHPLKKKNKVVEAGLETLLDRVEREAQEQTARTMELIQKTAVSAVAGGIFLVLATHRILWFGNILDGIIRFTLLILIPAFVLTWLTKHD